MSTFRVSSFIYKTKNKKERKTAIEERTNAKPAGKVGTREVDRQRRKETERHRAMHNPNQDRSTSRWT